VAQLFLEFFASPRNGEVYNLGGGRDNSLSILETIEVLDQMGHALEYQLTEKNRTGDHICYISDLQKIQSHFPAWKMEYNLERCINEIVSLQDERLRDRQDVVTPGTPI
jgi:CDP-paratose 2-epimerase